MPASTQCPKCDRWALICLARYKKSKCFACDWEYAGNWGQEEHNEYCKRIQADNRERAAQRELLRSQQ